MPIRLIRLRPACWALLVLLLSSVTAWAAPSFPELTGRVVDNADMIAGADKTRLTDMLAAHEQDTGEQVVVVTLPELAGRTIEEYGYQLGRHWGIGEKGEDTGALLIIAKAERKIRIEVGYGLEGRLTDAQSSIIVDQIITPAFRQGDFSQGIVDATAAMVRVLGGDPLAQPERGSHRNTKEPSIFRTLGFFALMIVIIGLFGSGGGGGRRGGRRRRGLWGVPIFMGGGFGGGGSGGFGGGGFSGGGGGFGGGGASGGW